MQHTATHCDTLRHTATHCDTLQHTATHCNTLQHMLLTTLARTHTHNLQRNAYRGRNGRETGDMRQTDRQRNRQKDRKTQSEESSASSWASSHSSASSSSSSRCDDNIFVMICNATCSTNGGLFVCASCVYRREKSRGGEGSECAQRHRQTGRDAEAEKRARLSAFLKGLILHF